MISKLDGVLTTVSVPAVLDNANRDAVTGNGCKPGATKQVAAFCWESGDNGTADWYPQGISSTADAYGDGKYGGRTAMFASWYYSGAGANKGVRVSFVDYPNPAAPKYRHVLLAEPYTNQAGQPDFRAVGVHAGGIFSYGYFLYVADTWGGFRAFDLRHLWQVKTGDKDKIGRQSDGSYQAYDYAYVLPQALTFKASTANGAALRYSAASLDRTNTPDSVVVPEYDAADRMFKESADGYTHATEAYRVDIKSMQGASAINGKFYASASTGSGTRGSLYTFTATSGPTQHATALPIGNEDLSYRGPQNQLWTLTEHPGKRFVVAVDPKKF